MGGEVYDLYLIVVFELFIYILEMYFWKDIWVYNFLLLVCGVFG